MPTSTPWRTPGRARCCASRSTARNWLARWPASPRRAPGLTGADGADRQELGGDHASAERARLGRADGGTGHERDAQHLAGLEFVMVADVGDGGPDAALL